MLSDDLGLGVVVMILDTIKSLTMSKLFLAMTLVLTEVSSMMFSWLTILDQIEMFSSLLSQYISNL